MQTVSNVFSHLKDALQRHAPKRHGIYLTFPDWSEGILVENETDFVKFFEEAKKSDMDSEAIAKSIMGGIVDNDRFLWEDVFPAIFEAIHKDLADIWRRQDQLEELIQKNK